MNPLRGNWSLTQTLLPSYNKDFQLFGFDVALDGDNLAVGAPFDIPFGTVFKEIGDVFLFSFDGNNWVESDHVQPMPALKKWQFGSSVDLVGTRLLAGAESADAFYGLAYVYDQDVSGKWVRSAAIASDRNTQFSCFGERVKLTEDGKSALASSSGTVSRWPSQALFISSKRTGATGHSTRSFSPLIKSPAIDTAERSRSKLAFLP